MKDTEADPLGPERALGDVPARRICLRCKAPFRSEGFGDRICKQCKGSVAWKTSSASGGGRARRR